MCWSWEKLIMDIIKTGRENAVDRTSLVTCRV